ncbi:class I SAM-dependent methyltransferase [Aliiruegeria haliotis]|nr:class I SAM-dependent methyltransferase [Aliiruegeria haliotis]
MEQRFDTKTEAIRHAPWRRLMDRSLGRARSVPTMLSLEEQKLYHWLTAFWADGAGAIVDLGCFAGGSTARLAEGHRIAGLVSAIHAYDRFTADEDVKQSILYKQGLSPFEGNDILPLARDLLAPWGDAIHFHRGEIDQMSWEGGPIEILVMDASKAAETMDRMAEAFFPYLVPGRSLIVQQDFLHWSQPWVPVQMERMPVHFTPLAYAPRDTVVFLCTEAPDREALATARTAHLSDSELVAHLEVAARSFSDWGLEQRLRDMIDGLRANPGKRRAYQFRKP